MKISNSYEEKKNNDNNTTIKKTVLEWSDNTTIGGFPYILRNKNYFLKIMWIVFFLLSSGYCFKLLVQTTIEFFSNPVSVKIQRIKDLDAFFPAISICSKF